jgi:uridine phosphorylase
LPGDPFRTDLIATYFDDAKLIAHNREHKTWTGYLNGEKVSVTSTGMGCPSTAIALEELIKCGADTFIRVGTAGRVCDESYDESLDGVINNAAVRDEGTTIHYIPIEYPAVADITVTNALIKAAGASSARYHTGVVQSKDSFYSQHSPETKPVSAELLAKWEAWKRMGCLASEMESAALFIVGQYRRVRVGACFLVMANQERAKAGLDNPVVHDTGAAIDLSVAAMRILIKNA